MYEGIKYRYKYIISENENLYNNKHVKKGVSLVKWRLDVWIRITYEESGEKIGRVSYMEKKT